MRTTDALIRLKDYQSRILAQLDEVVALLAAEPAVSRLPLAHGRWAMTRTLREYQLFKHVEIFDPAILDGDAARSLAARRMKAACTVAGEQFAAYVAQWSAQDVVAQWATFEPATRAMADAVRGHVAQERREVEGLLAGSERTRRLAG